MTYITCVVVITPRLLTHYHELEEAVAGSVGSAFGFGPGDLTSISSLCIALRFLYGGPFIKYQLYGASHEHFEAKLLV